MALNTQPNIAQADDFYQALIEAHAGLTEQESAALNARLILLLANQVGDLATLKEAIAAAKAAGDAADPRGGANGATQDARKH
jgi:Protein of unknown function (DUF2783)